MGTASDPRPGAPQGATVRRLVVGSQLRRLREAAGLTRAEAGDAIRGSESKISRLELERVGFKARDVADLLALYGLAVDDPRTAALESLAREANQPDWWQRYDDVMARWFQTYLGLEEAASLIRTYEIQFVPGLLQTEAYARAVIGAAKADLTGAEVDRRVNLRLGRQALLERAHSPRLWAVVDEAVLHRPFGGRHVMRAQLQHLLKMVERRDVTVQILPLRTGWHSAEAGAFTILRFEDAEVPDVVYVEQLVSALYLDKREQVDRYAEIMERLTVESPAPDRTPDVLNAMLKSL